MIKAKLVEAEGRACDVCGAEKSLLNNISNCPDEEGYYLCPKCSYKLFPALTKEEG